MDLDELKASWQRENKRNLELNKQSMEQLQLILQEKTTGTLTGIKKNYEKIISVILIGILLNVLVSPFLHFLLGDEGPVFRITFGGLLSLLTVVVIGIIVVFFYWLKYTSIKTTIPNNNLKMSLHESIDRLKKSLRQELGFIVILFIFIFIIGRISSQYLGHGNFDDIFHPDIMLAMAAMVGMMGFYIYKRIKIYKEKIRELQKYLTEYDENTRE